MFLHRSRVRFPAFFGALFLLLTGAADAFGVDACARHDGDHEHGAQVAASDPGAIAATSDDPHAGHAGHAGHHESSAAAPSGADGDAHSGVDEDESGCDCRFLCLAGATVAAPEAVVFTVESVPIPEAAVDGISTEVVGVVAQSLLPYVLPFPNPPPSHA